MRQMRMFTLRALLHEQNGSTSAMLGHNRTANYAKPGRYLRPDRPACGLAIGEPNLAQLQSRRSARITPVAAVVARVHPAAMRT
jgi:hypothetical protein